MALSRKPLYAPRGAVATSQPLAAAAGLAALRNGGNAVDAAIATAITLTVVQPGSNDIGSDLFALVWDGADLHGLNASGRAPAAMTLNLARSRAGAAGEALGGAQSGAAACMPPYGWVPVTVPGAPGGWRDLHGRFGSLPFADLFTDAIGYAAGGYPVSPGVAAHWRTAIERYVTLSGPEFAEWGRVFTVDGRAPRAGELWGNPDAARTLRLIAESGAEDFYRGKIAEGIVDAAERTGGLLRASDLAAHESTWVDPIRARYHGYDVWEIPPNGQGIAALVALSILDGVDLPGTDPMRRRHWQIEAIKLAFADAHAYVADPAAVPVPVAGLLSPEYAAARRALITEQAGDPPPGEPARGGTVYLCAADSDGMMVSLIQSNYMGFGSFVAVPGFGFGLQNRGCGFSLDPAHPNVVAGGKRPYHTIIPGFLTRDGAAVGPFGVMGGHMQPQGHLQLITSTVDDGLDPQAALDAPRWYWHTGRQVVVEPEMGPEALADLRRRGHEASVNDSDVYGFGQAIWRLPDGGYVAGSEARADGCAVGY
ncbi:MAG TPA: gamma-glutamyltransferase family protein [Rugosimonospora sp.]|nr:gamma-glutamyltransferase family protein [Rugosimonospora sp.]